MPLQRDASPRMASMLLTTYRALGAAANPLLRVFHGRRVKSGKEDVSRRDERFGRASVARPQGRLAWIHAASVGEANAVLPLVRATIERGFKVVMTTGTLTSAQVVAQIELEGLIHQFVPYDTLPNINRFLDHWQPELAITVESEIWPVMITELKRRKVPLIVINGRMSEGSFRNWQRVGGLARSVFGALKMVVAQSDADAERFKRLGVASAVNAGNIKFDGKAPSFDPEAVQELQQRIGQRPVWVAASTHPGEETQVLETHRLLTQAFPTLLTIIVPRHPKRGQLIAEEIAGFGLSVAQRSKGEEITPDTDVYLADTLGELGLFYKLASIVFVGGSLVPIGGHNLLEPAQLHCAIISGGNTTNFAAVYRQFNREGGALKASNPVELAAAVERLLNSPEEAEQLAVKAAELVAAGAGALNQTLEALEPFLRQETSRQRTKGEV